MPMEGRKRVRLFAPKDFARMYPNPSGARGRTVQFRVDTDAVDLEAFPLAKGCPCLEATVGPGEMLFIPAFWLHQVTAVDNSVSVNLFFGDAPSYKTGAHRSNYVEKLLTLPGTKAAFEYWLLVHKDPPPQPRACRFLKYIPSIHPYAISSKEHC